LVEDESGPNLPNEKKVAKRMYILSMMRRPLDPYILISCSRANHVRRDSDSIVSHRSFSHVGEDEPVWE
jgi:hypothetical protein